MHTVTRILKTCLLGLIDVFSFKGDFASSSVLPPQEHYVAHELLQWNIEVTYRLFVIPTAKVGWGLRVGTREGCERGRASERGEREKVWGVSECVPLEPNFSVLYPRADRSVGWTDRDSQTAPQNLPTDPSKLR